MTIPGQSKPDLNASKNTTDNICGVLVAARPKSCAHVKAQLESCPGVEVHEILDDGRIIITVEDTDGTFAPDTIAGINAIEGVLSASLVYHHFEKRSSL